MINRWACNCSPYGDDIAVGESDYRELLQIAKDAYAELRWWMIEHPCCEGHGLDLLERLNAVITKATGETL